jgi:peptidoglycan/LPS O-acetylase OafA/YrhL
MKSLLPNQARVPELDGIRGLAIFLIVFDHYIYAGVANNNSHLWAVWVRNIFPLSWSGVDLFFVLSGFLIGGILIDQRGSENYFKTFYLRRICRILPIYFLWVALFLILSRVFSAHASSGWYNTNFRPLPHFPAWVFFCFLQNFHIAQTMDFGAIWIGVTWSLCVEEQFYLLMPLVILFVPPKKLPIVLIGLMLLGIACRFFLYLYYSNIFTYVLLPTRMDGLLLGVFCAYLVRHSNGMKEFERRRDWLYLLLGVLFLGMIYLTVFARSLGEKMFADLNSFEMIFGYFWIDLFYASFLLVVLSAPTGLFARAMRFRPLCYLGIVSYSIYLTHGAIYCLLYSAIPGSLGWAAFLAFLATCSLAVLSWRFFEKPIIAWGHAFGYSRKTPQPPVLGNPAEEPPVTGKIEERN